MKPALKTGIAATQKRYKNGYKKKAWWEPQVRGGDEIYITRTQHAALASDAAERFGQYYNKLLQRI